MQKKYDLVVVGTGFASTFFLKKYLQKNDRKKRILVLERGYFVSNRDRRKKLAGEESAAAKLNPEWNETFVNHNKAKHWPFTIGFGGSSNCWYACTPRFLPSDFEMKTRFGVADDWPVRYDDLESYYTEVEEYMSIAGPADTPFPKSKPYPLPPHTFSTVDKLLNLKYGKLYVSQATARASRAVNGRSACCVNAVCSVCPVDAKFTIENSNMNVYEDERIELVYGAHVQRLDLSAGIAKAVVFVKDGREETVEGEIIALGANAIFNANILLNSNDAHPLTGKGIGEQIGLDATVYLDGLSNVGGSTWVTANGYMLYDGEHRKEAGACLMESNNAPYFRIEPGKWRNLITFRMILEDLPDDSNTVTKGKDPMIPEVNFKGPSPYAQKGISRMKEKLPDVLSVLPVERIEYSQPFETEAHILGTTRMSKDPAKGVVDDTLIHHRYRNLFVLGSGSFTTYSPNNPTLTLSALSLRAADKIFAS